MTGALKSSHDMYKILVWLSLTIAAFLTVVILMNQKFINQQR